MHKWHLKIPHLFMIKTFSKQLVKGNTSTDKGIHEILQVSPTNSERPISLQLKIWPKARMASFTTLYDTLMEVLVISNSKNKIHTD